MYLVLANMRRLISLSNMNSSSAPSMEMEGIHVISIPGAVPAPPASAVVADEIRRKRVAQVARKSHEYD